MVSGIFSFFIIPVVAFQLIGLLFVAGQLQQGAKPLEVGKAIYAVLAQTLGAVLMSVGGLPAVYSVLTGVPLHSMTYSGLLMVFAVGGVLYFISDARVKMLDPKSAAVPAGVVFFTWKFFGLFIFVGAVLSCMLQLLLLGPSQAPFWWPLHIIAILYGALLIWCTRIPKDTSVFKLFPRKKRK